MSVLHWAIEGLENGEDTTDVLASLVYDAEIDVIAAMYRLRGPLFGDEQIVLAVDAVGAALAPYVEPLKGE